MNALPKGDPFGKVGWDDPSRLVAAKADVSGCFGITLLGAKFFAVRRCVQKFNRFRARIILVAISNMKQQQPLSEYLQLVQIHLDPFSNVVAFTRRINMNEAVSYISQVPYHKPYNAAFFLAR